MQNGRHLRPADDGRPDQAYAKRLFRLSERDQRAILTDIRAGEGPAFPRQGGGILP